MPYCAVLAPVFLIIPVYTGPAGQTAPVPAGGRRTKQVTLTKKRKHGFFNVLSTILVALVVALALLLAGSRLIGFHVFAVLSGSMEPTYHVGSVIFVKSVPPEEIQIGQPITFLIDDNVTATHRVIDSYTDEKGQLFFTTKGDANAAADGAPVFSKNVIGIPVFTIPYLGYTVNYIQHPPGIYIAIAAIAVLLLAMFLPEVFRKDGEEDKQKGGGADSDPDATH